MSPTYRKQRRERIGAETPGAADGEGRAMTQKILLRGRDWMLWLWPYLVTRPRWGTEHGTDRRSHWLWLWCVQVWWSTKNTK